MSENKKSDEDKIAKAWKEKGKRCVILNLETHYTAYIETNLDVPADSGVGGLSDHETSPDNFIKVHGGLTFSGKLNLEPAPFHGEPYFFGWDYAHGGDHMDYGDGTGCINCKYERTCKKWTLKEVEEHVKEAVDQVIEYEKLHPKLKKAYDEYREKVDRILKEND